MVKYFLNTKLQQSDAIETILSGLMPNVVYHFLLVTVDYPVLEDVRMAVELYQNTNLTAVR